VLAWCLAAVAKDQGPATPKTVQEALAGPEAAQWKAAMAAELDALLSFGVWDPVPVALPAGKNAVDSKWLFRIKKGQDGAIERFKARLVARGFTQLEGEDYYDTFSSVAKWATVRTLLAMAASKGWAVEVCDVDNAFLNAKLNEEVYLVQPQGLSGAADKVLRLRRALYGLKQAPRSWEKELGQFLVKKGTRQCTSDTALYVKFNKAGQAVYIPIYVDDLLIVGTTQEMVDAAKQDLKGGFKLKDLGEVSSYLGVQVTRNKATKTMALGLPRYIQELQTKQAAALSTHPREANSPMVPATMKQLQQGEAAWGKEEAVPVARHAYMSLLGSLMFAAMTCRPDIAFAVSLLAQGGVDPRQVHMGALVRVLKYLVSTKDAKLVYKGAGGAVQPCIYTDSDWGSEKDGKSRAGWTGKVAGGAVTWYSKKLAMVASSSAEAEYKALSEGAKEAMWFRNLMTELSLPVSPVHIYCDNQGAVAISKNPIQHHKTRHFKLSWHFVRQAQEAGEVQVSFVPTNRQDADALTKALSTTLHKSAMERLGMEFN